MTIKATRNNTGFLPKVPFLVEDDIGVLYIVSYVLFKDSIPSEYAVNEVKIVDGNFVQILTRKNVSATDVTVYAGELVLKNTIA